MGAEAVGKSVGTHNRLVEKELNMTLFFNIPQQEKKPKVIGFVGGLGGRDISVAGFEEIVERGIEISETGSSQEFEIFGVRE